MLDYTKFLIKDLQIINRMLSHPDFILCKPKTNYYRSLEHKNSRIKLSLDFRKAMENGNIIGYGHLEICISPHYAYNQYNHNGNDLTPKNSIKTISHVLDYLGIESQEYPSLKVVNIEFGLNLIPETDIKKLINGIIFYKKTPFKVGDFPYFKVTNATNHKKIKAYAKGLQFLESPQFDININTFRFEVKTKQSRTIEKFGINTVSDLLEFDTYSRLGQILLNEWEQILLINEIPNLSNLKPDEVDFIKRATKTNFWKGLKDDSNRNKFNRYTEKYYKILKGKNNLHHSIKLQIIDKLNSFQRDANST